MNKHKVGVVLAGFLGLWHVIWSLLVALGMAKSVIDMALGLHFISISYTILPFDLGTAIGLVAMATIVGYVIGWVFAALWNWMRR
ncbi:MAG: hypothetical protein Q8R30_03730 [bacterium]|nr:hypothetical protein [bacterium]